MGDLMCNYIFLVSVFVTFLSHENIFAMHAEPARPVDAHAVPVAAVGGEVKHVSGSGDTKTEEIKIEDIKEEGVLSFQTLEIMGEALRAFGVTIPREIKSTKKKKFYSHQFYACNSEESKSAVIFFNEAHCAMLPGFMTWLCYEYAAILWLWQNSHDRQPDSFMYKQAPELALKKIFEKDIDITVVLAVLIRMLMDFYQNDQAIIFEALLKIFDREGWRIAVDFKPGDDNLEITIFASKGDLTSFLHGVSACMDPSDPIDHAASIIKRVCKLKIGSWSMHTGKKGFIPPDSVRAGLAAQLSRAGYVR